MSTCYLLGAGASCGYDDNLTEDQKFPLTDEFFLKGRKLGLFNSENFPQLIKHLDLYLKEHQLPPDEYRCNVEDYLSWLCLKVSSGSNPVTFLSSGNSVQKISNLKISSPNQDTQIALGECYYYIYELIRRLCLTYYPRFDNYRRLALHFFNDYYSVISLNYDLLFEMACESIGLPYSYTEMQPSQLRHIKLLKLHGSINWVNQTFGSAIVIKQPPAELYKQVVSNLYNVRYKINNIQVLSAQEIRSMTYRDIAVCGYNSFEPVIIPPLHEYKDYEKVKQYEKLWQTAKKELDLADEIVIIGCSIRKEDQKVNDLLKETLKSNKKVTICDRDSEAIKSKLPNNNNLDIKHYPSFTAYAKSL